MVNHVIVLGAGISGLTVALALHKHLPKPRPRISIYEIRSTPSTIGGAVNLTPKALRYLDHLGAYKLLLAEGAGAECRTIELFDFHSSKRIGEIDFRGSSGKGIGREGSQFYSMRTMRSQLQSVLLHLARSLDNVEIHFGEKVVEITESSTGVTLFFENGEEVTGDILLGCDGVHSGARNLLVEPSRLQAYTGVAVTMGTALARDANQLSWKTTAVISSRTGSLLASHYEPSRKHQYIATVRQTEEASNKEGWRALGSDQAAIRDAVLQQFSACAMKEVKELVEDVDEWTLYPVYQLSPKGRWISPGRKCILLGDSAHAMPPQGESTGICIEDAIVFARAMMHHETASIADIFEAYEKIRRGPVEAAYDEAVWRWQNVKDRGWFAHRMLMSLTSWFLWWTSSARDAEFAEDLTYLDVKI